MKKLCEGCGGEVDWGIKDVKETFNVLGREEVQVDARVAYCLQCKESLYDHELDEVNFAKAYAIYRQRHHIPSPDEIRDMRNLYGLSQKALGRLLKWGEVTVHRYESGAVPNPAHAETLRMLLDPQGMSVWISKLEVSPDVAKVKKALETLLPKEQEVSEVGRQLQLLLRQPAGVYTGNVKPSLHKLSNMIHYFATKSETSINKFALMELLFYADFRNFQKHGCAMSGMSYVATPSGPTLKRWLEVLAELNARGEISVELELKEGCEGDVVRSLAHCLMEVFDSAEPAILDEVWGKLGGIEVKQLMALSHGEEAYRTTPPGELIPYERAHSLAAFGDENLKN